jgi:hypothetical protein
MDEKYENVIRNVDRMQEKKIEEKTIEEYEALIKEIDEEIEKYNNRNKQKN